MKWSFGITTTGNSPYIQNLIESIRKQGVQHEIIICGGEKIKDTVHIPFDEEKYHNRLSLKKHIIAQTAKYENLCLLHDYFLLHDNWCKEFPEDFDLIQTKVVNLDGQRFSDWTISPYFCDIFLYNNSEFIEEFKKVNLTNIPMGGINGLPYNYNKLTKFQYISGGQIIGKTNIILESEIDAAKRCHGQNDDTEWAMRALPKYRYQMNPYSLSSVQKPKWVLYEIPDKVLPYMEEFLIKFNRYYVI